MQPCLGQDVASGAGGPKDRTAACGARAGAGTAGTARATSRHAMGPSSVVAVADQGRGGGLPADPAGTVSALGLVDDAAALVATAAAGTADSAAAGAETEGSLEAPPLAREGGLGGLGGGEGGEGGEAACSQHVATSHSEESAAPPSCVAASGSRAASRAPGPRPIAAAAARAENKRSGSSRSIAAAAAEATDRRRRCCGCCRCVCADRGRSIGSITVAAAGAQSHSLSAYRRRSIAATAA